MIDILTFTHFSVGAIFIWFLHGVALLVIFQCMLLVKLDAKEKKMLDILLASRMIYNPVLFTY